MVKVTSTAFPLMVVLLHLSVLPAQSADPTSPRTPPKCVAEADKKLSFEPGAITFTSVNVRSGVPQYSFLKGQWVLGDRVDVLTSNTCLSILEKQMVGVYQIWYLVEYKRDTVLKRGWVWGGTKDLDESQYIGGDTTPKQPPKEQGGSIAPPPGIPTGSVFSTLAFAQTDVPPGEPENQAGTGPQESRADATPVYWALPFLGWAVRVSVISAIVLFFAMVGGMLAKAVWDQTEGGKLKPPLVRIVRPLLVSPIAFSAFWTPLYVQQGNAWISLTMLLYAFQIGFMWQHVLEKKLTKEPS